MGQNCGEVYCSEACREAHFHHSHNLMCVGPIQQADHPLVKFKFFAIEHADTLLLAGQVLAHLVNRAKACGGGAAVIRNLMLELLSFCHAPFRDACRGPPGRPKDAEFLASTDQVVSEAASYLQGALAQHAPEEAAALFESGPHFFSEVLGLFEYNNIDVEIDSPVGALFTARVQALASVANVHAEAAAELAVVQRLLREKEWVMRCVWGEETTGIYGDDEGMEDATMEDEADLMSAPATDESGQSVEGQISAAMAAVRREVDALSLEQLLAKPWPAFHGTALFPTVARINHSCTPNLKIQFPGNGAWLQTLALSPLAPGQEMCISYVGEEADVAARRRRLQEYGFTCVCERCLHEDSSAARKTQKRLK